MHRIYLDANATTPLLPEVLEEMRPCFLEDFGNASSVHLRGQQARSAVERARSRVAGLLACRPSEIVFTSGGTEGDNLALFGMVKPGDHLITSTGEHHAVLHAAERLQQQGAEVSFVPVDGQGLLDPDEVRRALRPQTRLISVMTANNETGVIQPIAEIGRIAAEAEVFFHTDAVQAAGKIPLNVSSLGCDLLTIAGHKMHAPQGVGALYVRSGTPLEPVFYGGAQERRRRAGTENLPGIAGLGKAAECARLSLKNGAAARLAALRDSLEQGLLAQIADAGVNGGGAPRVANTANLWFGRLEGESLMIALDLKGLTLSTGAACASGSTEPSHVLLAMGLGLERTRASLRLSLLPQITEDEVGTVLDLIPAEVRRLRQLSPAASRRQGELVRE